MPLRKAAGNMYDFVTHTWNPVKGKCGYECSYCYVKRIANRFNRPQKEPGIDRKAFCANHGSGNHIFVCSTCDLFHDDISALWIGTLLDTTKQFPGNKYLWHTKNPARALEFQDRFGDNDMLCVTIESNIHRPQISKAPPPLDRLSALRRGWEKPWMLTVEPVMDFNLDVFLGALGWLLDCGKMPVQVNIGADSGGNKLPEPSPEKLRALIEWLEPRTKAHLKKNLGRLLNP